jgi:hypothetical protein
LTPKPKSWRQKATKNYIPKTIIVLRIPNKFSKPEIFFKRKWREIVACLPPAKAKALAYDMNQQQSAF